MPMFERLKDNKVERLKEVRSVRRESERNDIILPTVIKEFFR
jgi:hypothetical protein